ncbi:MAG: class I SAM-dependent methyltransferase [Desulfobacterales bacterium]
MKKTELPDAFRNQAEMLANRIKKRWNHLHKRFAKQGIEVFRLYDWDIPEIRAVVDWYAGHLVIGEYTRMQSVPEWLPMMAEAAANALNVPIENVHLKERKAGKQEGKRYERLDYTDKKMAVSERDLKFWVNLSDFVDTGLFSDHRNTRQMVRELAAGKDFLNLYCYTGTFTCAAAKGGARSTVSADRSETVIQWAKENLELNGIPERGNTLMQTDAFDFLRKAKRQNQTFDLAVVDPPSYSSTRSRNQEFDIVTDHPLLLETVISLMKKGGIIFFSANHQNFEPRMDHLRAQEIKEITSLTIPEDYVSKKKQMHRCWKITA